MTDALPLEPGSAPEPGRPVALSALVARATAPNPGIMTGPGTNTYLAGTDELVVVDPGPDDPGHLDALAELGSGQVRWIVVTHTHPDHAPGAAGLALPVIAVRIAAAIDCAAPATRCGSPR